MKKNEFLVKLYNSKIFWMIVSLIAAFALWIYVTSVQGDEYRRTFNNVQVVLVGEDALRQSKNLVVTDLDVSSVIVEVTGPRRIITGLDSSDISARIDVSKLNTAAYTSQNYTVAFSDGIDTSSLTVNSKTPDTVNFMVSQVATKTIQVRGSFDGSVVENRTAETPQFEPSVITITGPENYINNVSYAWVSFGSGSVDSTYHEEVGYTLMDADGNPCSNANISASDETVMATLTILEIKDVPLALDLTYAAGATDQNTVVTIEPSTIQLAGDSDVLSGLNKIVLGQLDLSSFEATFSETYTIQLDESLRNLSGVSEAKVTVEVKHLVTKKIKVSNISCINTTAGFTSNVLTNELEVTLRGPAESIEQVTAANVRAVADLKDYNQSTGTFMPLVKIYVDGYTDIGAIGDNYISITLQ